MQVEPCNYVIWQRPKEQILQKANTRGKQQLKPPNQDTYFLTAETQTQKHRHTYTLAWEGKKRLRSPSCKEIMSLNRCSIISFPFRTFRRPALPCPFACNV